MLAMWTCRAYIDVGLQMNLRFLHDVVLTGRGGKEAYPPRSEIPEGHHWGLPG